MLAACAVADMLRRTIEHPYESIQISAAVVVTEVTIRASDASIGLSYYASLAAMERGAPPLRRETVGLTEAEAAMWFSEAALAQEGTSPLRQAEAYLAAQWSEASASGAPVIGAQVYAPVPEPAPLAADGEALTSAGA